MNTISAKRFGKNLKGSLKEAFHIVVDYPQRFREKSMAGKAFSLGKLALLPVCYHLMEDKHPAAQALAVADLAGVYVMQRIKLNSHFNAFAVPLSGLLIAQMMYLGSVASYSTAFMTGVVGVRNTAMASMPDTDEYQPLRSKVSFGLTSINLGVLGVVGAMYQPHVFMLVGGIMLSAWATSMINAKSHVASALRLPGYVTSIFYNAAYTGSASAAISSGMSTLNRIYTIWENDIPVKDKNGVSLRFLDRVRAYNDTLLDYKKRQNFDFRQNPEY